MSNSTIIDEIIEKIYLIQEEADPKYWKDGLFPNYRSNKYFNYSRPDNSIFFTASIIYILENIKVLLSDKSQKLIDEIAIKGKSNYPNYKSIKEENVYNFYPTNPSAHFANGLIFRRFKHFQLPHDADDTVLIYLTFPFSEHENIVLKNKLAQHANGRFKKIKNTFEKYQKLKAYSTWFGDKMAIEFDVCVLSNVLLWQLETGVALDDYGLDSWEYIKQTILSNEYLSDPFKVSHNYAKTEIIAYHVSRLISKFELPDNQIVKEKLKGDLILLYQNKKEFSFSKLLLSTALQRLGENAEIQLPINLDGKEISDFSFFLAGLLSAYENPVFKRLAHLSITHINWTCQAHSLALIAENLSINLKK